MILLNPGPVTLTPHVRQAMQGPDLCHREPEFAELCLRIIDRLGQVYPAADYRPVLLSGSGSAAVEAMLASFAPRSGGTLVAANGVYGERMATMLNLQGKPVVSVAGTWTEAIDIAALESALDAHPEITHLATVHHETTTGRLNDLEPIVGLCRRRGLKLLLDAVSSFAGEAIPVAAPLLAVAATANKCLHGVPGVSLVLVAEAALEEPSQSPCLYFDLHRYAKEQRKGFSPFTMAVQSCYALDAALEEFLAEGGVAARNQRYRQRSLAVRNKLVALGCQPLLEESANSSMLTAYQLPAQGYASLHDRLKEAGFIIYAGQGELARTIFRIATMGAISDADLQRLLDTLEAIL